MAEEPYDRNADPANDDRENNHHRPMPLISDAEDVVVNTVNHLGDTSHIRTQELNEQHLNENGEELHATTNENDTYAESETAAAPPHSQQHLSYPSHSSGMIMMNYPALNIPSFQSSYQYNPPLSSGNHHPSDMIRFYEAQMRDHAAAYASAAAGAAWAAAHWASQTAASPNLILFPPPPPLPPAALATSPPFPLPQQTVHPNAHAPMVFPQQQQQQQHLPNWHPHPMLHEDETYHTSNVDLYHPQHLQPPFPQPPEQYHVSNKSGEQDILGEQPKDDYEHRRKRQQRSQDDTENPQGISHSFLNSRNMMQQQSQSRGKIRRRLRSDNDSSSSGSSYFPQRNSTSRRQNPRHASKKKKQATIPSDESLVGKTIIAAFYEWCGKRQTTPIFDVQKLESPNDWECVVYLECDPNQKDNDDTMKERGRGRGSNKSAARHEAARQALMAVLPGVVFDSSGLVEALPPNTIQHNKRSNRENDCGMDDLAPNLAKNLAIGKDYQLRHDTSSAPVNSNNKRLPKHRTYGVFPETSTTSEDDNNNILGTIGDEEDLSGYYSSRGASVCSTLLHHIIMIDRIRTPETPHYDYQPKRKDIGMKSDKACSLNLRRLNIPPFTCTGRLKVLSTAVARKQSIDNSTHTKEKSNETENVVATTDSPSSDHEFLVTLEAHAVAGTKREARHIVNAKLLAQLFPECENMVQVKEAAEAMRERNLVNKSSVTHQWKEQGQRNYSDIDCALSSDCDTSGATEWSLIRRRSYRTQHEEDFAFAHATDPALPNALTDALVILLEQEQVRTGIRKNHSSLICRTSAEEDEELVSSVNAVMLADTIEPPRPNPASLFRQLSRQKQLFAQVDLALQNMNERDEEGRSLPDELTEDDVGRTVLRRAEPEDMAKIRKLFHDYRESKLSRSRSFDGSNTSPKAPVPCRTGLASLDEIGVSPGSTHQDGSLCDEKDKNRFVIEPMTRLWSSSNIVLLLCRAIAPQEDPLGCAFLSMRFSMTSGRALCLNHVATKPHLPPERFLECLQDFAKCLWSRPKVDTTTVLLSTSSPKNSRSTTLRLSTHDMVSIVESHVAVSADEKPRARPSDDTSLSNGPSIALRQLQSVQEEEDECDEEDTSSVEKRISNKKQSSSKPSKRSRFA